MADFQRDFPNMCGITGLININNEPVSPVVLKKMTDTISHRGPDGEGHWVEDNVGIGHRRLAIIDLSPAGHQPMINAGNRYLLSYMARSIISENCAVSWRLRGIIFDLKQIVKLF